MSGKHEIVTVQQDIKIFEIFSVNVTEKLGGYSKLPEESFFFIITYFVKSLSTRPQLLQPTSPYPLLIRRVVPRETHSFSITSHSFSCSVMAASTIPSNSLVFLFLCSVFSCISAADGSLGRGKLDLVNKNEYFSACDLKSVFALLQAIGVYYR